MNTSSSDADTVPIGGGENGDEGASKWMVRFFLILAFGLAFGIEGMTLIRSYFLPEENTKEQVAEASGERREEPAEETAAPLRIGEDLLPATDVTERITEIKIRARSDGPWVFRLAVTVTNDEENPYRLSLRELETDDGTVFDEVYAVDCPPGDSTKLVATWSIGANVRPRSLTAEAELGGSEDSTRTAQRRVSFGHVPVQMER